MFEIFRALIDNNIPITANILLLHLKKHYYAGQVIEQLSKLGFVDDSDYLPDGKVKLRRLKHKYFSIKILIDGE